MIQINSLLKQNLIGKLLNHSVVFLINILIVRMLGVSESGFYFNELYVFNFVVFIFSFGLDYSAISWINREPGLLHSIHRKLFRVVLFFIAIIAFFSLIILPLLDMPLRQSGWAVILFCSGNLLLIFFQGILSALRKFNLQNKLLVSTNLIFLCFLWLIDRSHFSDKLMVITLGYGAVFFLQGIIMMAVSYPRKKTIETEINWKPFYKYGIFIMLSSLAYFTFLRVDNFFVEKYSSPATLSNYVQCGKIGQYFLYFSTIISSTVLPFVISKNLGNSFSEWKKFMRPYIFLIFIFAVFIALFGKWIFPFLFGKAFNEMIEYMIILLPGYVCLGILTLVNAIYLGKGNIKKIFKGDVMGMLIVLILDSIFVPQYGAKGAAIISSATYIWVFIYLWIDLKNQFESE